MAILDYGCHKHLCSFVYMNLWGGKCQHSNQWKRNSTTAVPSLLPCRLEQLKYRVGSVRVGGHWSLATGHYFSSCLTNCRLPDVMTLPPDWHTDHCPPPHPLTSVHRQMYWPWLTASLVDPCSFTDILTPYPLPDIPTPARTLTYWAIPTPSVIEPCQPHHLLIQATSSHLLITD